LRKGYGWLDFSFSAPKSLETFGIAGPFRLFRSAPTIREAAAPARATRLPAKSGTSAASR
jgi:hypothetical protein